MKQFIIQYRKEFSAYFYGLNAYVVLGIYSILSLISTLYAGEYFLRKTDVMNAYFIMQPLVLLLIIPAITMRTWSDEIKSGTMELLLTQPIGYPTLILAKFTAAYTFFAIMVAFSLPLLIVSHNFAILDMGQLCSAYAGLFLMGAMFTAAGCCLSVLCRNNIISYIATIFLLFIISQFKFGDIGGEALFLSLTALNFNYNYSAFLSGTISLANIVYFLCGACLFLWLNLFFLNSRQTLDGKKAKATTVFISLLFLIFFSIVASFYLLLPQEFDFTTTRRYTLLGENADYLRGLNKRINVRLYEAKVKRDEANSNYAAFAEYVERLLKRIQQYSMGNVRYEVSRIESLSAFERQLIQENIPYEEDAWGNKIYMAADFSDNDGNHLRINSFNSLRLNFIETDIIRSLQRLGQERKNIAIFASSEDLKRLQTFSNILQEFYNVTYLSDDAIYIPSTYNTVIVISPNYISRELLLAMEQYVMAGGTLMLFHEPLLLADDSNPQITHFLNSYGIKPVISSGNSASSVYFKEATPISPDKWKDVHSVIMYSAGDIQTKTSPNYKVTPLLTADGKTTAVQSNGKFATNFPDLATQSDQILSFSTQEGNVFFIYNSDMLYDNILASNISQNKSFYQTVPLADNLLFLLRLVDYATKSQIESGLSYRSYPINYSSIGITIFNHIEKQHEEKMQTLNKQLASYNMQYDDLKNIMKNKGYASAKNIGSINNITQKIDETVDELNRARKLISQEYQNYIVMITIFLTLIIPALLLFLLWVAMLSIRKYRLKRIRRLTADA